MSEDEQASEIQFEAGRKEARRAAWALNSLVVLSALAGAFFFGYVLHTVWPRGGDVPPVEIPVSSPGAKIGMLAGERDGLSVVLRDIDEAPTYREELGKVMLKDLGINKPGRLYVLEVRNEGEQPAQFAPEAFNVADKDAKQWTVQWLANVTSPDKATAVGKLRLAQSEHRFELEKGRQRQLYVFVESGGAPSAEDFVMGALKMTGGELKLEHTEVKVAQR